MDENKVLEGKKLIAEYMEYKQYTGFNDYFRHGDYAIPTMKYYKYSSQQEENIEVDSYPLYALKFDTSWDWIMPVVKKIFAFDMDKLVKESGGWCAYYSLETWLVDVNIDKVFETCVKFIEWYNLYKED